MILLTKIFRFETAHALAGYTGKCKNVHGHSYQLHVTVSGIPEKNENSPTYGMVIDFGDLKEIVNKNIITIFDHATVLNENSSSITLGKYLEENNHRVVYMQTQPTCENMLYYFAEILEQKLPNHVRLEKLKLFETENSYGEWIRKDNIQ
ncbi:MAG: 6-carboxytetrahydropterin synthase [Flavobacteriales bacterium]|nr:6-carboxytetrahydropterin synthase [Flavobacteriales bacterium]